MNHTCATMPKSFIMACVNNSFTVFKLDGLLLIYHFSCSRWCRCLSLMLVTRADAV